MSREKEGKKAMLWALSLLWLSGTGCDGENSPGDRASVAYHFQAGEHRRYRVSSRLDVDIRHAERSVPFSFKWDLTLAIRTLEVNEEGVADLEWRIESPSIEESTFQAQEEDRKPEYVRGMIDSLSAILVDTARQIRMDAKGTWYGREENKLTFDLLLPLLPSLPGGELNVGDQFQSEKDVILPVLGLVHVRQDLALASAGLQTPIPTFTLKGSMTSERPELTPRGLFGVPLEWRGYRQWGSDRLVLGDDGLPRERQLSFHIEAKLRARIGDEGIKVAPVILNVGLINEVQLIR